MNYNLNNIKIKNFKTFAELLVNQDTTIDNLIKYVSIITNQTIEEVEEMDLDEFKAVANDAAFIEDLIDKPMTTTITINGKTYKSTLKETFAFNVKQISMLTKKVKESDDYIADLAALIFREVAEDGLLINDFSDAAVSSRKAIFADELTIDILIPYLKQLEKHFQK